MTIQPFAKHDNCQKRSWYDRLSAKAETTLSEPFDEIPGNEDWRKDGAIPTLTPFRAVLCSLWVGSIVGAWFAIYWLLNMPLYSMSAVVNWLTAYEILSASAFILYIIHKLPIYYIKRKHKIALGEWRRLQAQRYIDSIAQQIENTIYIERFDAPSRLVVAEFILTSMIVYYLTPLHINAVQRHAMLIVFSVFAIGMSTFHTSLIYNYVFGFIALTESKLIIRSGMFIKSTFCINLTDITKVRLRTSVGSNSPRIAYLLVKTPGHTFSSGYSIYNRGFRIYRLLKAQLAAAREKADLQPLDEGSI